MLLLCNRASVNGLALGGGFASVILCCDGEFGWVGGSCADSSSPSPGIYLSTEQLFGNMISQWTKTCPCTKGGP